MNHFYKSIALLMIVSGLLTACASSTSSAAKGSLTVKQRDALLAMLQQQQDNEALLASWKEARPSVMRLVAIDSELALLIEQLDKLANKNTNKTATTQKEHEHKAPSPAKPAALPPASSSPAATITTAQLAGKHTIQLAAMGSLPKVQAFWQKLQATQSQLVKHYSARYEQDTSANNTIYRLKLGEFDSQQQAIKVCDGLLAQGIPCFSSTYADNSIKL